MTNNNPMKTSRFILLSVLLLASLVSCNEESFLDEVPLDFMSASNSYVTVNDFDASINELYFLVRKEFYGTYDRNQDYLQGADILIVADPLKSNLAADMSVSSNLAKAHWDNLFLLIAQSNVVISRLPKSSLTAEQKTVFEAKARFFRGFAYRTLAYLYGGVPIQLEEVTTPKTDYVRATRNDVLLQAIDDVDFASKHLADITKVKDGEISASAAYFLLSELYLAIGENRKAANAASVVIDNPALDLMTSRFGSRKTEPGDVYFDLFSINNQNRSSGNTEGVWVIQEEVNVLGGGANTNEYFWSTNSYWLERFCAPQTGLFQFVAEDGSKTINPFVWPTGDWTGGRGIGTMYCVPHFYRTVWGSDFNNDMRNSQYNFPRKFKFNNPQFLQDYGTLFGDSFDLENPTIPAGWTIKAGYDNGVTPANQLPNRFMCGYQTKCTTPFTHPDAQYLNKSTWLLSGTAGKTYTDQYLFRLAEAYLLRAEAYVQLGNKDSAAIDVNVVRRRANASDATAAQMDLDYILDERIREFGIEEKRRLTLARTGTLTDRIQRYNPYYSAANSTDGIGWQTKYELYPIPLSAIESNKDADLGNNPSYEN